jgi:exonuclease SbcC
MIPLRVRLKGFLCYKDEQDVCFDGSSLWMLSGLNGSGKSAVFDGVTYALFGHHRGGSQKVEELINKNSDGLEVEFEFLQEGQGYRIRRVAKRKSGGGISSTQQIYRRSTGTGNGKASWDVITDTQKKTDFDSWIRDNIGLNYETFTSSVLLLQGKAEKLLDSTAKGRFEVLAGIVDLDRYRNLHEKSEDLRRTCDAAVKGWRDRLAGLPEISALELLEAETAVQTADKARQDAWQELQRWQGLEFQAQQWLEKTRQLAQTRQQWQDAQALMASAGKIESDLKRLRELQTILPVVKAASDQRTQIQQSERDLNRLHEQQQKCEQELGRLDDALQQSRQKRSLLDTKAVEEDRKLREIGVELRSVTASLAKLKEFERLEADLLRLQEEIKLLPEHPVQVLHKARVEFDQLTALAQTVPHLIRFDALRKELRESLERESVTGAALQHIEKHGKQLAAEVDRLAGQLNQLIAAKQQADEETTRTRTLLEQTRQALQDLLQVGGAKVCRHCGQELTPGHVHDEKKRREKELAEGEHRHNQALEQQRKVHAEEKKVRDEHHHADQQRQEARVEYRTKLHEAEQAKKDVDRLRLDCQRTFRDLPECYRDKISLDPTPDWVRTIFPTRAELGSLRGEAGQLDSARQRLQQAEAMLNQWHQYQGREANLQQSLQRMEEELPRDRQKLRDNHVRLETEEKSLEKSLQSTRKLLGENQQEIDRLGQQRERIHSEWSKGQGEIQTQTATRDHCQRELARILKSLPEEWRQPVEHAGYGELQAWTLELNQLIEKRTEECAQQLQNARLTVANWQQQCTDLENQLQQFPEEVRQGPESVKLRLAETRDRYKQRDDELSQARKIFDKIDHDYKQREEWQHEYLAADRELAHAKLLAELLGRERLQLHLVRQAERQVVDHANAVLDRLSGGELYLRLCGEAGGDGNSAKALELEAHNRITGEKPINVAFLSGSQKFRVAVSLALGIGQYASRQHRPIESVIIDEGFGCLDRNARQVMIQELQNLRTQMRCILLVSHQEEFAEAFTDGYHFELQNGTTIARRFQR